MGDTGEWNEEEVDYMALKGDEEMVVETMLKNVEVRNNDQV